MAATENLGILLVGSLDFNFWGFYINCNKEAKSLTFRRGSEVSQGLHSDVRAERAEADERLCCDLTPEGLRSGVP